MTEPNEVINAIHHCIADEDFIQRREGPSCAGCPYEDDPVCVATLKSDIQKLLKAQEPKLVHVTVDINRRKFGECPNCGKMINSGEYQNYCGRCGQAVKWE